MNSKPAFRTITAPLSATDADLDRLNEQMRVPAMVRGVQANEAPPVPQPRPQRPINILVPDYVAKAVRQLTHDEECSIRCVVLKALAKNGIDVDASDLIADARRSKNLGE